MTEQAKVPLKKALELDGSDADANAALALVFQAQAEPELADQYFQKALATRPGDPRLLNNYGSFLFAQKRYAQASEYFQQAAADTLYPERSRVFENLGVTSMLLGQRDTARQQLEKALHLNQRQPRALLEMAELSFEDRHYVPARDYYERFSLLSGQNARETLRQARESNGWSLAEVALKLNLTTTSLGNLEAGAFDKLPGHTFARGYIRAYAKLLGIDQAALVQEFDQITGTDSQGSNVHGLGRIEEPVRVSHTILRIVSLLLLIAVIGGGFVWWQDQTAQRGKDLSSNAMEHVEVESADGTTQIHPLDEPEDQAVAQGQAAPEAEPSAEQPAPEAGTAAAVAPVAPAPAVAVTPAAPAHTPATPAVPAQAPATTAPVAPAISAPTTPVLIAGDGRVQITYVADCWTQVSDGNGKVLFSGLKRKGDTLDQGGKPPLTLRLGFARGAQVAYNGQPVDVAPFTSGETARLNMTNSDTNDVAATVAQINRLEAAGVDIVRVSVPDMDAAEAFGRIKQLVKVPLVADIHFDYKIALRVAELGVDCLRINPGNIGREDRVRAVVDAARDRGIPIRIGVNAGSLEKDLQKKYGEPTPAALVESALRHVEHLERLNFQDFKVSVKASDVFMAVEAYRLLAKEIVQPLHLGITEAGGLRSGTVKSAVGLGMLLADGIGDTIRISLAADPVEEVKVGYDILKSLHLRSRGINFIACPSCSRQNFDVVKTMNELEVRLEDLLVPLDVAVIGCVVNGPGEAKEAHVGLTGGTPNLIYIDGKPSQKLTNDNLVDELERLIRQKAAEKVEADAAVIARG
eukprot:gene20931-32294_t